MRRRLPAFTGVESTRIRRGGVRGVPLLLYLSLATCTAGPLCGALSVSRVASRAKRAANVLDFRWNSVSPDGRLVLVHASPLGPMPEPAEPTAVVDWTTGRTGVWRRIPIGLVTAWNPQGGLIALFHDRYGRSGPIQRLLACRRLPDLSEVWRIIGGGGYAAWAPDGRQIVAAVSHEVAGAWDLEMVSRSGVRRTIVKGCTWIPNRVVEHGGQLTIVCSSKGSNPAPLTLIGADGSILAQLGPKFPPGGHYIVGRSLDQFAWQAQNDGDCFLLVKEGGAWNRIKVEIPPTRSSGYSRLVATGDDHLMLIQNADSVSVWALGWSGKLRRLRLPPGNEGLAFPWNDNRHLIRAHGNRLELIDGYTGRIARTVAVRLPE